METCMHITDQNPHSAKHCHAWLHEACSLPRTRLMEFALPLHMPKAAFNSATPNHEQLQSRCSMSVYAAQQA